MAEAIWNFINKFREYLFTIGIFYLFFFVLHNFIDIYIGALIYHIILGIRWAFSTLGWQSSHIFAIFTVMFLPEILMYSKKVIQKF